MRKLWKRIYNQMKWLKKFWVFCKENKKAGKDSFVIFCTPEHSNIGDHAIVYAELKFLKNIDSSKDILELPSFLMRGNRMLIQKMIGNRMIFITGGGFLGTLWMNEENTVRSIINTFHNNKIIIFPQTIYFTDTEEGKRERVISRSIYDNHPNLWLCAREEKSYSIAKEMFDKVHVELVPDMVPYLNGFRYNLPRRGALLCLRRDKEKAISVEYEIQIKEILSHNIQNEYIQYVDTVMEYNISKEEREKEINNKIIEFAKSSIVITDRLHGMVFAALTGTPCIAFGNCDHKVKGTYNWIKDNEYIVFLEDINYMNDQVKRLLKMKNNFYNNDKLAEKYSLLENIIKLEH